MIRVTLYLSIILFLGTAGAREKFEIGFTIDSSVLLPKECDYLEEQDRYVCSYNSQYDSRVDFYDSDEAKRNFEEAISSPAIGDINDPLIVMHSSSGKLNDQVHYSLEYLASDIYLFVYTVCQDGRCISAISSEKSFVASLFFQLSPTLVGNFDSKNDL